MRTSHILICLSLLFAAGTQAGELLPPGATDVRPAQLVQAPLPDRPLERAPLHFAWALDPAAELALPAAHRAESREYWTVAEAAQLRKGLDIDTTAPGAVIRISPEAGARPVPARGLRVGKGGRWLAEAESVQRRARASELQAVGMAVPEGSMVLQLAESQGRGRFQLQVPDARGRYLVHVFEPASPYVLSAQSRQPRVLAGEELEVAVVLRRNRQALRAARLEGELVSPDGRRFPLDLRAGLARVSVPMLEDTAPGLWEVHVFAGTVDGGQVVQREVRTAVEVARPTARLAGRYAFDARALRLELPVQVAAAGRYELRGTLYATGPDGLSRPVAQAHAAQWLEPGTRRLALPFGAQLLPPGHGAPFEVRHLELKDQSRMGTLETRALALRQ